MPVEIFDLILEFACGTYLDDHGLYVDTRSQRTRYIRCRDALAATSRAWREAVIGKSSLWNAYQGRTHRSLAKFEEWTSRMGPGEVDLRLIFETGQARPDQVSAPKLAALIKSKSRHYVTLSLSLVDDDEADAVCTVLHSCLFPRIRNLSVTLLDGRDHRYNHYPRDKPLHGTFVQFPQMLKDLCVDGFRVPWDSAFSEKSTLWQCIGSKNGHQSTRKMKDTHTLYE
jgi:hypothetical protein